MPPYAHPECPYCGHKNRFDLAELKNKNAITYKDIFREDEEEFYVTCSNCGRDFKFKTKGGQDDATKSPTRGG